MKKLTTAFLLIVQLIFFSVNPALADSLWTAKTAVNNSYFGEQPVEPRQVHDIVFVLIEESTVADADSESEFEKSTDVSGEVSSWFTFNGFKNILKFINPSNDDDDQTVFGRTDVNTNLPEWGVSLSNDFEGEAETNRTHTVKTKLAAEIIEILPNGNFILEAKRNVRINNETLILLMTGLARPNDIDEENQIFSSKIAELNFSVTGRGEITRSTTPGIITKVLSFLS